MLSFCIGKWAKVLICDSRDCHRRNQSGSYHSTGALNELALDGSTISTRSYDAGRRQTTEVLGNGITETRSYRSDNLLSGISYSNTSLGDLSYTWDANKNKTSETVTGVMSGYGFTSGGTTYDFEDRLTGYARASGTFNQSWNLTSVGDWTSVTTNGIAQNRTHGPTHELLTAGGSSVVTNVKGNMTVIPAVLSGLQPPASSLFLSWDFDNKPTSADIDANGNMTRRTLKSDNSYIEYTYDHRDRLTDVRYRTSAGTLTKRVHFGYDALNRRYLQTVENGSGTILSTVYYVNQGFRKDRGDAGDEIALRLDGTGAVISRYLHGSMVDEVLAEENIGSGGVRDVLWAMTDHQGSVRDLARVTSGTASVVNHIVYDAFGKTVSETDAAIAHLYGYTGRELDKETGLQYNRARYLDLVLARWISQDPIGFAAGDTNLYRYVGNHPNMATDPSGLWEEPEKDAEGRYISGGGWDFEGMTVVNGYEVRSNWLGYILSTPGVYVFWPLFGGGPRTTPAPKGPTILDLESSRKARQVYQEQFVNGNLGSSQASPNIPDNEILVMSTLAQGDIEFYGVASGLATPLEGAGLPRGTGGSSGGGKAPVSGMPRTSAPSQFVRVDVARSLGAARHSMMDKLDDVLKRHGGTQTSEGFFKFPSRKAARAAASEIAGDLGHAPTAIRKSDFRGGPWSWKNSNGVIGRQMLDPSNPANSLRGWRDDILGHKFDDGTIIGPHVNVWNDFFENLHFTY